MELDTGHNVAVKNLSNIILSRVSFIFFYFVLRPTNAQLFHKLSHSYMFRHYYVILRELVMNTWIVNCITNGWIWNTCVTSQGIDYKVPEDDTIVSKQVVMW
jgi:hypothetical protein